MRNPNIDKYPFVYAWGRFLGSFSYYIMGQIKRAIEENAPKTAIYKDEVNDVWKTVDEVQSKNGKRVLSNIIYEIFKDDDCLEELLEHLK